MNWSYDLSGQPELFAGRGFTGHEHLPWFNLVNMNGRLYDPATGRFLSPDNFVQMPDFTQNFNRYSYCLNNPLKYTDLSGDFIWIIPNFGWSKSGGLSIGISVVVGIPGGASTQVGGGFNFKSNEVYGYAGATLAMNTIYTSVSSISGWSLGYSAGASIYSGIPLSTNFLTVGVNYNISHGSWSGNASAWSIDRNGWTFNPSVSAMIFPEHTTNLFRGQGFRSNDNVLSRFVNSGNQQGALDYFGFKAKYHPGLSPSYFPTGDYYGVTQLNGDIEVGNLAFQDFGTLKGTYIKETYHSMKISKGLAFSKVPKQYQGLGFDIFPEEIEGYMYAYKRQGLFIKNKIPWDGVSAYISQLQVFGIIPPATSYPKSWIYKIPRKW